MRLFLPVIIFKMSVHNVHILIFDQMYVYNKYLVIYIYIFKLISNFSNVIIALVSHYSANEILKCLL